MKKKYVLTDDISKRLKLAYTEGKLKKNGKLQEISKRFNIPAYKLIEWASEMNLYQKSEKYSGGKNYRGWSQEEIDLLTRYSERNPAVIAKVFKENGFDRTSASISLKRSKLKLYKKNSIMKKEKSCKSKLIFYSLEQVSEKLGVPYDTVFDWVRRGYIKHRNKDVMKTPYDLYISDRDISEFFKEYNPLINMDSIDKGWIMSILF